MIWNNSKHFPSQPRFLMRICFTPCRAQHNQVITSPSQNLWNWGLNREAWEELEAGNIVVLPPNPSRLDDLQCQGKAPSWCRFGSQGKGSQLRPGHSSAHGYLSAALQRLAQNQNTSGSSENPDQPHQNGKTHNSCENPWTSQGNLQGFALEESTTEFPCLDWKKRLLLWCSTTLCYSTSVLLSPFTRGLCPPLWFIYIPSSHGFSFPYFPIVCGISGGQPHVPYRSLPFALPLYLRLLTLRPLASDPIFNPENSLDLSLLSLNTSVCVCKINLSGTYTGDPSCLSLLS